MKKYTHEYVYNDICINATICISMYIFKYKYIQMYIHIHKNVEIYIHLYDIYIYTSVYDYKYTCT